ncbi:MAG: cellobiose phosphorylase [Candidatus Omnitrophica bacterium]|nr:cellobiose phosphorylase [Candidatus Omnitrophota bacterium]
MTEQSDLYAFEGNSMSFKSFQAFQSRLLYFPLCGIDDSGIKSAITPYLSGDIKVEKNRFVTKPVSREDLRQGLRDFYIYIPTKGVFHLAQADTSEKCHIEAGLLWHRAVRYFNDVGLCMESLNFVPVTGHNVEVMRVKITNTSDQALSFTPTGVIPLWARSLANKHDHEHVTSLLNRIEQLPNGVMVRPTMKFNEEGHQLNDAVYYVLGVTDQAENPIGSFPTIECFLGDASRLERPAAVFENADPAKLQDCCLNGKEAVGALRFSDVSLDPQQSKEYILIIGCSESVDDVKRTYESLNTISLIDQAWHATQHWWQKKSSSITFRNDDQRFTAWMHWVTIQPVLRRIYGCSFLPDHDYGKGGKGWRDIWQDLLSLILIEPEQVRGQLVNNFFGIRIDGSNATIIGAKQGEFIADRNAITRVWMDHGVWPLMTILLYIHQTGDLDILLEKASFFRDMQMSRTFLKDLNAPVDTQELLTQAGDVYQGHIIEHLLVQNLVQFFNVGEHNITRLESADWNDGLDMAFDRGESVAFMCAYAGNLRDLAGLLENFSERKEIKQIPLAKEFLLLLDRLSESPVNYDSIDDKKIQLFDLYFAAVQPKISGVKVDVSIIDIVADLREKADWIGAHVRKNEWIKTQCEAREYAWFNGYYDNLGYRVEGEKGDTIRMTLTGQVFPVMSGVATPEQMADIVKSVSRFLIDKKIGGVRLNSNFGVDHYLEFGRAFGFAFGTKENGAFFSHMIIMYAFALYKQGFVNEGYSVLQSIYQMSSNTPRSKIYPGVPEYFDSQGQGMYHYLTGSASWYVLTMLTQRFGIRGEWGDLVLEPKLTVNEFNDQNIASVDFHFAGKRMHVRYENPNRLNYGDYKITTVKVNDSNHDVQIDHAKCHIARVSLSPLKTVNITVVLDH